MPLNFPIHRLVMIEQLKSRLTNMVLEEEGKNQDKLFILMLIIFLININFGN